MIYIKKHKDVLAACDSELVGKKFSEKKIQLDVKESFYKGELVGKNKFMQEFLNAKNLNLVGENTISFASEKINLDVMKVKNIPYAIIFRF